MSGPTSTPKFCSECGSPLQPGAKFCSECGTRVAAPPATPAPAAPTPDPTTQPLAPEADQKSAVPADIPPELRAKFEGARSELRGQRREVVVVFADVSGYTAMSEQLDAEEVTLVMQGLMRELADAVYRYEGYVDKYIGDAIMALFGAPLAHENDAERAVLAALDMLQVIVRRKSESKHPISMRIGLNLGEVVAGHMGSEMQLQYTVMGDAVNVASRLEGKAEPDTILISHAVYERVSNRFETEEVPPLTVKGKSEPLRAHRVIRYRPALRAPANPTTPFVGREEELAAVEAFLTRLAAGVADTLYVEADAGAGKTRLVREALARTEVSLRPIELGFSPIQLPGQLPVPAHLFLQLVGEDDSDAMARRAFDALGGLDEEHRDGIEGLAHQAAGERTVDAMDDTAKLARQNRWIALAKLLATMAEERPVLVILEDVHWSDEAADEFLQFLVPTVAGKRVGFLVNARPGSSWPWLSDEAERLRLRRLDEGDAESILGELFADLSPQARRELLRRSEGNPLYLEELSRSMRESVEAMAMSVPGSLQGLLQSRIDQLERPLQVLLEMAAVLGLRFPVELLRRMYGLETQAVDFETALDALAAGSFVEPVPEREAEHRFRHALMQETAYGRLLVRVRKVLHESAARLGEEHYTDRLEVEAPFFAHHYWEADLKPEAAPHLWRAGSAAAGEYELPAAERHLGRLAEVVEAEPTILEASADRASFFETYGSVLLDRGRLSPAADWFERLHRLGREEAVSDWQAAGIKYQAHVAWYKGRIEEAETLYRQGLSIEGVEDRLLADLHNGLGIVHYYRDETEPALDHHGRALELRQKIDDQLGMAKSYLNIGNVLNFRKGDREGAEEHYGQALDLAKLAGDRHMSSLALGNLGLIAVEHGDWAIALKRYERVEELAEETGWRLGRYMSLMNQADCLVSMGQVGDAIRMLEVGIREGDDILEPQARVAIRLHLFEAYIRISADDRAAAALEEARNVARELEVGRCDDWIAIARGRLLELEDDPASAAEAFALAAAHAERLDHNTELSLARALRARALARAGLDELAPLPDEARSLRPLKAILRFLAADVEALREPSRESALALGAVGEQAAELGDVGLERAAFERQAEVWGELGEGASQRAALERAAKAMAKIEASLSGDLREQFAGHPRNAALRGLVTV